MYKSLSGLAPAYLAGRRLRADLICGQQTAPVVLRPADARKLIIIIIIIIYYAKRQHINTQSSVRYPSDKKNGTQRQRLRRLQCSRLELYDDRTPSYSLTVVTFADT